MEPKTVVRRFVDEYQTKADERAFAELLHPDVLDHSRPPGIAAGADGVHQQFDGFRAAFDGFRAEILDQIAEGDKVVTRMTARGTHEGDLPGIPATGNRLEMTATAIHRIEDGKLAEHWSNKDELAFLQQLGVIPTPETAHAE